MSKPVLLLKLVLIPDLPHVRTQHMELYDAVNVTESWSLAPWRAEALLLLDRVFNAANKQGYFPLDVGKSALKCFQAFHPA